MTSNPESSSAMISHHERIDLELVNQDQLIISKHETALSIIVPSLTMNNNIELLAMLPKTNRHENIYQPTSSIINHHHEPW